MFTVNISIVIDMYNDYYLIELFIHTTTHHHIILPSSVWREGNNLLSNQA